MSHKNTVLRCDFRAFKFWKLVQQYFVITVLMVFPVVVNINESQAAGIDYQKLNNQMDKMIENLYGDIEPEREFFGDTRTTRYAEHNGEDNALHFSNEWLVNVPEGNETADIVAAKSGYQNLGQVKGFPNIYLMRKLDHPEAHSRNARELTKQLALHNSVAWAEQQTSKLREKRDLNLVDLLQKFRDDDFSNFISTLGNRPYPLLNVNEALFIDPLWEKQWYMQDTRTRRSLPRLDLNILPVFNMGVTGKDINVVILDDGLEHTHEDLIDNYNPKISGDLNDNDEDPMPHYGGSVNNAHGTRCAGEVAMKANNSKCGVGIAYNSKIGGVRMLDGPVSDRVEGSALSYANDLVHIYSASWGPSDDGETVEGPGRLAQAALLKGVTHGRDGKGIIYVWASGNGGSKGDCCSCDGYASNVFTLSIGSASESGIFPWYGEKCPSTMAVTYSSGAYTDQKVATTDWKNDCTTSHTGTSASAPLAAGIVALVLEANPKLTWRDIQHLVVWTSQPGPLIDNPGWKVNGVGFHFNSRFGFGLMDAYGMVTTGLNWTTVPQQRTCSIKASELSSKVIDPLEPKIVEFISSACRGTPNEINFLEHVEVISNVRYSSRGSLQIDLTSPQGTRTRLLFPRKRDVSATGFSNWPFVSVHTWGENPFGKWILNLTDSTGDKEHQGTMGDTEIIFHGTYEKPNHMSLGARVYPQEYKKKSLIPYPDPREKPSERLRAILEDMDAWMMN